VRRDVIDQLVDTSLAVGCTAPRALGEHKRAQLAQQHVAAPAGLSLIKPVPTLLCCLLGLLCELGRLRPDPVHKSHVKRLRAD